MNKQINKFTNLTIKQRIDLYHQLIYPILSYCSEVGDLLMVHRLKVYTCNSVKSYSGLKSQHKINFIHGEISRISHKTSR